PPTSLPRSMRTTPSSPSPSTQRRASTRYRGSNTWRGRTIVGKSTVPSGNMGSSLMPASSGPDGLGRGRLGVGGEDVDQVVLQAGAGGLGGQLVGQEGELQRRAV